MTTRSPKKHKAKTQTFAVEQATPDATATKLEACFLGTIIFDVRQLELKWPEAQKNRNISHLQVKNLQQTFMWGIRRTYAPDRLSGTIPEAEFDKILEHTAQRRKDKGEDVSVESLRDDANRRVIEEYPVIYKGADIHPVLRNGQHRVKALLSVNQEQDANAAKKKKNKNGEIIQPTGWRDYMWAINLYSAEKCKGDLLAALSTNAQSVALANSEGYSAYQILSEFEVADNNRKLEIAKNFGPWAQQTYGLRPSSSARALQVTKHRQWRRNIKRYTSTRYGESVFHWSTVSLMIACRLDTFWFQEFNCYFEWVDEVLGNKQNVILKEDYTLLFEVPTEKREYYLRLLFFPQRNDYWQNNKQISNLKVKWRPDSQFKVTTKFPALSKAVHVGGHEFRNRRPHFLADLDDEEYIGVFERLRALKGPKAIAPSWKTWTELHKTVMNKVKDLLKHVCIWVKPEWVFPERAAEQLQKFDFVDEIHKVFWDSKPEERTTSIKLIKAIIELVKEDSLWQDKEITEQIQDYPQPVESPSNKQYVQRFDDPVWHELLELILKFKPGCLKGCMEPLNELSEARGVSRTWGHITAEANLRRNMLLAKTPRIILGKTKDIIMSEAEIFGAAIHYRLLKKMMLDTIKWGWKVPIRRQPKRPECLITSPDEYSAALTILSQLAGRLTAHGWNVEIDNSHEDLDAFSMARNRTPYNRTPKPGFLELYPPMYASKEIEERETILEIVQMHKATSVLRVESRKRKRENEEVLVHAITKFSQSPPMDLTCQDGTILSDEEKKNYANQLQALAKTPLAIGDDPHAEGAKDPSEVWEEILKLRASFKLDNGDEDQNENGDNTDQEYEEGAGSNSEDGENSGGLDVEDTAAYIYS
ncbi:hypothetical protein BJX63DRAFT_438697 [Aspergillus granulosus]|uniref:Uncharacterized protein n=1 Tax=Aspergillus granulosus TaxID=176169 RepID=A0ABR4GSP2_9EURO